MDHFTLVSREAVIVTLHDADTVDEAWKPAWRRFFLGVTPHEALGIRSQPIANPEPS